MNDIATDVASSDPIKGRPAPEDPKRTRNALQGAIALCKVRSVNWGGTRATGSSKE
jgi:hypothetical protein